MGDHILVDIADRAVVAYRCEVLRIPGMPLAEIVDFFCHILFDHPACALERRYDIIGKGLAVDSTQRYFLDIAAEIAKLVEDGGFCDGPSSSGFLEMSYYGNAFRRVLWKSLDVQYSGR